jgi:uncharacterized protein YpuA (DUF1002 family)
MTIEDKIRKIVDNTLFSAFYYNGPEKDMERLVKDAVRSLKNLGVNFPVNKTEDKLHQYAIEAYEARWDIDTANEMFLADVCDRAYDSIKSIVLNIEPDEERE